MNTLVRTSVLKSLGSHDGLLNVIGCVPPKMVIPEVPGLTGFENVSRNVTWGGDKRLPAAGAAD